MMCERQYERSFFPREEKVYRIAVDILQFHVGVRIIEFEMV